MIDHYGGVTEVPITSEMMQCVREARSKYREALEKEKKEAAKSEKEKEETIQAAEKRKAEAESKKAWEEKKVDLEQEIASSKEYISKQENSRRDATEKALKLTDPAKMKMLMMTAKFASEGAEKRSKILNEKQDELAKHMGKKRRQMGRASSGLGFKWAGLQEGRIGSASFCGEILLCALHCLVLCTVEINVYFQIQSFY